MGSEVHESNEKKDHLAYITSSPEVMNAMHPAAIWKWMGVWMISSATGISGSRSLPVG